MGCKWTDFLSPTGKTAKESTSTDSEYEQIKFAVIQGFDAKRKKLLSYTTQEARTLNEADKDARRKAQQAVGSKVKDIKNALYKRQVPQTKAPNRARTLDQWCLDTCHDFEKKLRNGEDATFDVNKAFDALKVLYKIVKTKV
jgi:hypothetical protein